MMLGSIALSLAWLIATAPAPLGAASAPAASEAPFSFDRAPGRLPKDVVPTAYRIAIVPNLAQKTIAGTESVTLTVRRSERTIVFNELGVKLQHVTFDGAPVASAKTTDATQLATVTLAAPAKPGRHVLAMRYTAKLVEGTPQGLFYQPYAAPGGKSGVLLSTQFESTDARRMFPCWDEPAFRATYTLSATIPSKWNATSNMPIASHVAHGALATTTFETSPKMPSYLVEFTAGDIAEIQATGPRTKFGVWAVRGQENDGAYALANAQQILADYDDYFGFPFPLPKLDSIAIPGGFQGAMENWGAITYNDQTLLVTPSSTVGAKQEVYSIQAHEMAHQWNGDLVTMGWWDDLWLNESFASWMSAKETDVRNPTWKWWEHQDEDKEGAMSADARLTSHPIQVHVTDELQAENAFDPEITYSKGQAFLRMLEAYLGPDVFRDGVRRYMKSRAFSNATTADLWAALGAASGKDVRALSNEWTTQAGFPIVSAAATCAADGARTIALSQRRFLLSGSDTAASHWNVPLVIRSGATGTPQSVLLTTDGQSVAAGRCGEPLSIDADAVGFYRASYDDATLATNRAQFGSLPDGDKIALLDDQWALGSSGQAPLSAYLGLVSAMGPGLDSRAWSQVATSLGTIEYGERGTAGYDAFTSYARGVLSPLAKQLGWDAKPDETPGTIDLRSQVLGDLGEWGDPATIVEAKARFATYLKTPASLTPDQQGIVTNVVAANADQTTFDQLHALAKASKNESESRRNYVALMHVRDPELAKQAIAIALSSEIPPQEESMRPFLVRAVGDYNPRLSWTTLVANTDRLLKPLGTFEPIAIAQYVPDGAWNAAPADEIEAWAKARIPAEMAPNLARGMESVHFKLARKAILNTAADAYVVQRGSRLKLGAPVASPAPHS